MMTVLWALWLACLGEQPGAALHHSNLWNDSEMSLRTAKPLRSNVGANKEGATNEASGLKVARSQRTSHAKQVSSTHKIYVPGEGEVQRQRQSSSSHKSYVPGKFAKWPHREELWPSMIG